MIPAILEVLPPPELLLETTPINFRVFAGDSSPAPRIVYLTAKNRAVDFTLAASTSSGGNWLSVTASGTSTPANLSIAVGLGRSPARFVRRRDQRPRSQRL